LSAWLSLGCLSPRKVYWQVKEAESKFGGNSNFNQILLGLLWRDYFRFMFKKHGIAFFQDPEFGKRIILVCGLMKLRDPNWITGSQERRVMQ
jgi:deoxyribodipyrimidine photo-lyase